MKLKCENIKQTAFNEYIGRIFVGSETPNCKSLHSEELNILQIYIQKLLYTT